MCVWVRRPSLDPGDLLQSGDLSLDSLVEEGQELGVLGGAVLGAVRIDCVFACQAGGVAIAEDLVGEHLGERARVVGQVHVEIKNLL